MGATGAVQLSDYSGHQEERNVFAASRWTVMREEQRGKEETGVRRPRMQNLR
jgi:hypothetical protein